jgi:hypothetical protein
VAVWEQFDGEHYNIWANSRRAHQDWGAARMIHASRTGHSYNPRVAINGSGQAEAVWVQMDSASGSYDIWSSRMEPGSGWARPSQIQTGNAGPTYAPDVAMDERGNAVAAWQQSDGRHVNVRASRFAAGTGWGKASRLERGGGDLGAPHVALDADGNAMVVWPRFHLDHSDLWASRHVHGEPSGGQDHWDSARRIDSVPGYVPSPQVVASPAALPGQFTVLWEQQQGFRSGAGASHFSPGRGWRAAGQPCAAQLQALGTAGGEAAGETVIKPAQVDVCY